MGAIQRRGEIVDRIDASFDAGLEVLDRPTAKRRPVSEWPLAPYSALRGSADLPPYHSERYTVDNHTAGAPLVRPSPHAHPARSRMTVFIHLPRSRSRCVCARSCRAPGTSASVLASVAINSQKTTAP
jgi:hypothetical protein